MQKTLPLKLNKLILFVFPKATDCKNGHIGKRIETPYEEMTDDRYYRMIITRCSHCDMPLNERYA